MNNLAIDTPRGKEAVEDQKRAGEIITSAHPDIRLVFTPFNGPGSFDAFFMRANELYSVCEIKTRYDMDERMFWKVRKGEWLITLSKLEHLQKVSRECSVPGVGVLYLKRSGLVIMKALFDSEGRWICDHRSDYTETQATINGGSAFRHNAFVDMHNAELIREQEEPMVDPVPPVTRDPGPAEMGPPRFAGAPPHCLKANKMAFASREDAVDFLYSIAMVGKRFWVCPWCNRWHHESHPIKKYG